jgi:hypothetical protein
MSEGGGSREEQADQRLREAFAAIPRARASIAWTSGPAAHDAVCAYVAARKATGDPPERVLAALKTLVRAAVGPTLARRDLDALVERTVHWCIEEYYRRH